jgi:fumarate reductase subunit D
MNALLYTEFIGKIFLERISVLTPVIILHRFQHAYSDGRLEDALLNHNDADGASAAIARLMRWVFYILPSFLCEAILRLRY